MRFRVTHTFVCRVRQMSKWLGDIRYAFDEKKEWQFAADVMEDLVNAIKQQSW